MSSLKSALHREYSLFPLRPYEAILAALGFALFGSILPWWGLVVPAFLLGFITGPRLKWASSNVSVASASRLGSTAATIAKIGIGKWRVHRLPTSVGVGVIAALTWLVPALVHDVVSGGRVSTRLAMVLGLPSAILVYLITVMIAFVVAGLGAQAGVSLRRLMQPVLPEFLRM
jgi:hypothetical protein